MEAANRGAHDVGAWSIGLNITLPKEQFPNPYVTPELCCSFRYFAMRKSHFVMRARALVVFPGGYGTMDELFEILELSQTRKMPPVPVVLVGEQYLAPRLRPSTSSPSRGHDRSGGPPPVLFAEAAAADLAHHPRLVRAQRRAAAAAGYRGTSHCRKRQMRLAFHGAARSITGSCHMIECGARRLLVDCGMFQGGRDLDEENAADFGFDPGSIDAVLLTHAHLDHCGRLPLLVKRGFRGEVLCTAATRDLARLVLLDAAHLQEEEHRRRQRQYRRRGGEAEALPLYSLLDALDSLDRFRRVAVYGGSLELAHGLRISFHDAGHILGSASIMVNATEDGQRRRVLFSGDIGSTGRPLLPPPSPPAAADVVVMKSTYGDRVHRPYADLVEELYAAITDTFSPVATSSFRPSRSNARRRSSSFYGGASRRVRLPPSMAVFLDSPMAIAATEIFKRHPECYSSELGRLFAGGGDPFGFPNLHFTRESAEFDRDQPDQRRRRDHGRVRDVHRRSRPAPSAHNLWRPEASIIFVGFAAHGTTARQIIDGAPHVTLLGEEIAVRARDSHDQRLLRPCRPAGADCLAARHRGRR